ncbi:hypothetical protein [Saccharothrix sp. NRRL B-16348]|uniref:hypothetical protein n=1 Tax=Saccharothrix sp. NRRL B-16348 TaxID=1415542 RepID=UPI0012F96DB3|nr:hypothetical protein [Saccharothrix sp. NRRL B-16348]
MKMSERGIFLAEFDDDYQRVAGLDGDSLRQRIRCYFLLAPSLLVHPAYVWQAPLTHSIVNREAAGILAPPFTKIVLGDSPSLSEYMNQRIAKLARGKTSESNMELLQYRRWGIDLTTQAAELSERFVDSAVSFKDSRDSMFRQLLLRDLSNSTVAGESLREQIVQHVMRYQQPVSVKKIIRALRGFISGAPLVSLDSVVDFFRRQHLPGLAKDGKFYSRLLVLYYRANVDDGYVVAGLPTLDPNDPTIHPYDPHLFWRVVSHVFGPSVGEALANDESPSVRNLLLRLKTDSDWQLFVKDYNKLRVDMEKTLIAETDQLAGELEMQSGYAKLKLLPRVWRKQKSELVTSILGLAFAAPTAMDPGFLAIGGGVTAIIGTALTLRPIRRFRDEYEHHYLSRLKKSLRRGIRLAVNQTGTADRQHSG